MTTNHSKPQRYYSPNKRSGRTRLFRHQVRLKSGVIAWVIVGAIVSGMLTFAVLSAHESLDAGRQTAFGIIGAGIGAAMAASIYCLLELAKGHRR